MDKGKKRKQGRKSKVFRYVKLPRAQFYYLGIYKFRFCRKNCSVVLLEFMHYDR